MSAALRQIEVGRPWSRGEKSKPDWIGRNSRRNT